MEWGGITMTDLAVDQLRSGVVSLRQIWQWISYGVGWYHYDRFGSGSVMEWGGITTTDLAVDQLRSGVVSLRQI